MGIDNFSGEMRALPMFTVDVYILHVGWGWTVGGESTQRGYRGAS